MTLSIGAATDYLVATATTAVAGIAVNGEPVAVVDGWPDELVFGMFVVGLDEPPPDGAAGTTEAREWKGLGAKQLEEDYTIPCYVDVRIGGKVQKPARDAAEAIFNAFWAGLIPDLTLGGVLKSGRFAEISELTSVPSNVGTVAEPGRRHVIRFGVHCQNLTT